LHRISPDVSLSPHVGVWSGRKLGMTVIDLDLTDEHGLLCEDFAERNAAGTRALLAALNLGMTGWQRKQNIDEDR